jgi:hypothetical protein
MNYLCMCTNSTYILLYLLFFLQIIQLPRMMNVLMMLYYTLKEEILVKIEDISIKQRYLVGLLDKSKWLDDEVSTPY